MLGIKQDALAIDLGLSQQTVSQLEQKEELDAVMLKKIAEVLKVPEEAIKSFTEEAAINIISSTLHDNAGSINNNCSLTFNPIEKIIELYERIVQVEREKVEMMKEMMEEVSISYNEIQFLNVTY